MKHLFATLLCLCLPGLATADEGQDAFVRANLQAVLFHELGHAIIDVVQLPVFGQEEDAADVLSVILINDLFEEDQAQDITYAAAYGFAAEADSDSEPAYWDVHGPDQQRFYTLVCLFYGANPEARADLAEELGLPVERAETCEEEFALAKDSWGPVLDDLSAQAPGNSMTLAPIAPDLATRLSADLLRAEVAMLNADFVLPTPIELRLDTCGHPNVFYDPEAHSITLCREFEPHLRALWANY